MKKYKINEIFFSIQGEGYFAGTPAVFVRFSGCNLKCPWCDTKHEDGKYYTKEELEQEVENLLGKDKPYVMIILTGGEPTLQLHEDEPLFQDRFVAIETNGTNIVPSWVSWITVSPKTNLLPKDFKNFPDEIKVVFEKSRVDYYDTLKHYGGRLYLQPLEKDGKMNIKETLEYINKNPMYRLSVQLHKLIGVR